MNKYLLEGLHNSGISIKLQNKTKTALLAEDFTPCSLQSDVFFPNLFDYNTKLYEHLIHNVVKTNTAWRL